VVNSSRHTDFELRIRSVLIALPPFLFLVIFRDWTLLGVFLVLSFMSFLEFIRVVLSSPSQGITTFLIVLSLFLFYCPTIFPIGVPYLGWYGFFLVLILWGFLDHGKIAERIGFFLLGMVYCIVLPFSWVKTGLTFGRFTVLGFALLVWLNDISAYLVGKKWGRHKIIPRISPGKSWEGLISGIAFTCGGAIGVRFLFSLSWTVTQSLAIGAIMAMVAFLGDIFESAIKREFQLKDSGHFLPGHGGFLDRFDSFFLAGPVVYFINSWWGG